MQFNLLGNTVDVQGLRDTDIREISSSQRKRMQETNPISAFHHLTLQTNHQTDLQDFSDVSPP